MSNFLDDFTTLELLANSCDDIDDLKELPPEDAATRDEVEDAILTVLRIDQVLERLPTPFRTLMELLYAYRASPGYAGLWPPTALDVGRYLGDRFYNGHLIPVRTIWRWHEAVLTHWRRAGVANDTIGAFNAIGLLVPACSALRRAA